MHLQEPLGLSNYLAVFAGSSGTRLRRFTTRRLQAKRFLNICKVASCEVNFEKADVDWRVRSEVGAEPVLRLHTRWRQQPSRPELPPTAPPDRESRVSQGEIPKEVTVNISLKGLPFSLGVRRRMCKVISDVSSPGWQAARGWSKG